MTRYDKLSPFYTLRENKEPLCCEALVYVDSLKKPAFPE